MKTEFILMTVVSEGFLAEKGQDDICVVEDFRPSGRLDQKCCRPERGSKETCEEAAVLRTSRSPSIPLGPGDSV